MQAYQKKSHLIKQRQIYKQDTTALSYAAYW